MSLYFDELHEMIYFEATKAYFNEVINSYYNGNYRSSIVMLYSVVITDIILKLEELKNLYEDANANSIIEEINELRDQNQTSADWERQLLHKLKGNHNFLDNKIIEDIEYLRKLRHICAHPALDQNNELYLPSKAIVAGCLDNMLIGVLTKPPIFAQKITARLINDIANLRENFINDDESFKKYLVDVYLKRMTNSMYISVYRSLWKLAFFSDNKDCSDNRKINCRCLKHMYSYKKILVLENIKTNNSFYSNINPSVNIINYTIYYLSYFPEIYQHLNAGAKALIEAHANSQNDVRIVAYFLLSSMKEHIGFLQRNVEKYESLDELEFLTKIVIETGDSISELMFVLIEVFSKSNRFVVANERFDKLIKPYLKFYSADHLASLFSAIDTNSQIYARGYRMLEDNEYIMKRCSEVLPSEFDYSIYKNYYSNSR